MEKIQGQIIQWAIHTHQADKSEYPAIRLT